VISDIHLLLLMFLLQIPVVLLFLLFLDRIVPIQPVSWIADIPRPGAVRYATRFAVFKLSPGRRIVCRSSGWSWRPPSCDMLNNIDWRVGKDGIAIHSDGKEAEQGFSENSVVVCLQSRGRVVFALYKLRTRTNRKEVRTRSDT
jgi:hypothetical protein